MRGTDRYGLWVRLAVAVTIFCVLELIALLAGLRILTLHRWLDLSLLMSACMLGALVEIWLVTLSHDTKASWLRGYWGLAYMVPIMLASSGHMVGYYLWLSPIAFSALLLRIAYGVRSALHRDEEAGEAVQFSGILDSNGKEEDGEE